MTLLCMNFKMYSIIPIILTHHEFILHGLQPCHGERACVTQWSYTMQGQTIWMGHSEVFWQNVVHWKRNHNPLQYSFLEIFKDSSISQKDMALEGDLPAWHVSSMLLGKSRGQLIISLERMKRLTSSMKIYNTFWK